MAGSFRKIWAIIRRVIWFLLASIGTACLVYGIIVLLFSTDEDKHLMAENRLYESRYADMVEQEKILSEAIKSMEATDKKIYRQIFYSDAPSASGLAPEMFAENLDSLSDSYFQGRSATKAGRLSEKAFNISTDLSESVDEILSNGDEVPPMLLPIRGVGYSRIGASVGMRYHPFYKTEVYHSGLDIIASVGDDVIATADGLVTVVVRSSKSKGGQVEIDHGNGYVTRYYFLSDISVSKGREVKAGTRIASVGMSLASFAPHLHYEVIREGETMDPVNYFFADVSPEEYVRMAYMAASTRQSMD